LEAWEWTDRQYLVFETVALTLGTVEAAKAHLQFVIEDQQLIHSRPDVASKLDQWQ